MRGVVALVEASGDGVGVLLLVEVEDVGEERVGEAVRDAVRGERHAARRVDPLPREVHDEVAARAHVGGEPGVAHVGGQRHRGVVCGAVPGVREALVAAVDVDAGDEAGLVAVEVHVVGVVARRDAALVAAEEVAAGGVAEEAEVVVAEVAHGGAVDVGRGVLSLGRLARGLGRRQERVAEEVAAPVRRADGEDAGDAVAAGRQRLDPPLRRAAGVAALEVLAGGEAAHGVAHEDDAVLTGVGREDGRDHAAQRVALLLYGLLVGIALGGEEAAGRVAAVLLQERVARVLVPEVLPVVGVEAAGREGVALVHKRHEHVIVRRADDAVGPGDALLVLVGVEHGVEHVGAGAPDGRHVGLRREGLPVSSGCRCSRGGRGWGRGSRQRAGQRRQRRGP